MCMSVKYSFTKLCFILTFHFTKKYWNLLICLKFPKMQNHRSTSPAGVLSACNSLPCKQGSSAAVNRSNSILVGCYKHVLKHGGSKVRYQTIDIVGALSETCCLVSLSKKVFPRPLLEYLRRGGSISL